MLFVKSSLILTYWLELTYTTNLCRKDLMREGERLNVRGLEEHMYLGPGLMVLGEDKLVGMLGRLTS